MAPTAAAAGHTASRPCRRSAPRPTLPLLAPSPNRLPSRHRLFPCLPLPAVVHHLQARQVQGAARLLRPRGGARDCIHGGCLGWAGLGWMAAAAGGVEAPVCGCQASRHLSHTPCPLVPELRAGGGAARAAQPRAGAPLAEAGADHARERAHAGGWARAAGVGGALCTGLGWAAMGCSEPGWPTNQASCTACGLGPNQPNWTVHPLPLATHLSFLHLHPTGVPRLSRAAGQAERPRLCTQRAVGTALPGEVGCAGRRRCRAAVGAGVPAHGAACRLGSVAQPLPSLGSDHRRCAPTRPPSPPQQMGNAVCPQVAGGLGRCLALAAAHRSPPGAILVAVPDPEYDEVGGVAASAGEGGSLAWLVGGRGWLMARSARLDVVLGTLPAAGGACMLAPTPPAPPFHLVPAAGQGL